MAETEADIGYGTWLRPGNGGSPNEVFADMGIEITSITPPGYTREAPDASHASSPDKFREYIEGMMDAGEVQCEINWVPKLDDPVLAALIDGKKNWRIGNAEWPITMTFKAIVTNYAPSAPFDDKMTASVTLKVSGKPTIAAAA